MLDQSDQSTFKPIRNLTVDSFYSAGAVLNESLFVSGGGSSKGNTKLIQKIKITYLNHEYFRGFLGKDRVHFTKLPKNWS